MGNMWFALFATWPLWVVVLALCLVYATLPKYNGRR